MALDPMSERKALRGAILDLLAERSAEATTLAARLGLELHVVVAGELDVLAWAGLVDALDPPEPCGRESLRWFRVGDDRLSVVRRRRQDQRAA